MSRTPTVPTPARSPRLAAAVLLGAACLAAGSASASPLHHRHHRHVRALAPVVAPVQPVYDESDNFPVSPPDLFGDGAGGEQTPGRGSYGFFGLGAY